MENGSFCFLAKRTIREVHTWVWRTVPGERDGRGFYSSFCKCCTHINMYIFNFDKKLHN